MCAWQQVLGQRSRGEANNAGTFPCSRIARGIHRNKGPRAKSTTYNSAVGKTFPFRRDRLQAQAPWRVGVPRC